MDHERTLAASAFPGDTGEARATTRQRLVEAWSDVPTSYLRAVAALCTDRLLVPVVATRTRQGQTLGGLTSDKEAEMSVVLLQKADGGRAGVAFTGLDTLHAWRTEARPVPVTLDVIARATAAERAEALIVDPGSPHPLVIDGEVLTQLVAGHRLVELAEAEFGWAQPTS